MHDRHGQPLAAGELVTITGRVAGLVGDREKLPPGVMTLVVEVVAPDGRTSRFNVRSDQCEKAGLAMTLPVRPSDDPFVPQHSE